MDINSLKELSEGVSFLSFFLFFPFESWANDDSEGRVKDVLCYLQLVDNPNYTPAFLRTINVPKRGLGDKSIKAILASADLKGISAFDTCVKIANGFGLVGVNEAGRMGIRKFVKVVRKLRNMAESVSLIIISSWVLLLLSTDQI